MSSTTAEPTTAAYGEPAPRTRPGPAYYLLKGVKALASLQLTVVLFSFAILLVFFGTLAQIEYGIWTVVDKYFWSWTVWVPFDLFAKFGQVFWKEKFPPGTHWPGSFPFPAGKLVGLLMVVNLLAAHALRFRVSWKRSGILFIHSGVLLLFVGEFVTREFAVEQRMTIQEEQSVNYTENNRLVELAVTNKSGADTDQVTVIPQNILRKGNGRITHPDLPVDIQVEEYMVNSALKDPAPGQTNRATAGFGKAMVAVKQAEVSGVDPKQTIDLPAAYVTLYKKGTDEKLGTHLVALRLYLMGSSDEFVVDGKKHELVLRFKRYYKPYRVHLDNFQFDRYMGTEKPKNFSSAVRVIDENGKLLKEQTIAMNEPMRFAGETFYQSSFDDATEEATVLQVVKNPGWLNFWFFEAPIDYIACGFVSFGLLLHFGIYLISFLRRPTARAVATVAANAPALTGAPAPIPAVRYLPWVMLAVAGIYLLSVFGRMNPEREPFNLEAVGRIPVTEGGRVKPLDTLARVQLRMISGREEFIDEKGNKQPAIKWFLEVMSGGGVQQRGPAWKYKVFRIDNEQVQLELGLKPNADLRYSLEDIGPNIDRLEKRANDARLKAKAGQKPDLTETKFKELADRVGLFMQISQFYPTPKIPGSALLLPPQSAGDEWKSFGEFRQQGLRDAMLATMIDLQKKITANDRLELLTRDEEKRIIQQMHGFDLDQDPPERRGKLVKESIDVLKMKPEMIADERRRDWMLAAMELLSVSERQQSADLLKKSFEDRLASYPAAQSWDKIVTAYRENKPTEFNKLVAEYRAEHLSAVPDRNEGQTWFARRFYAPFNVVGKIRTEITYNRFAPFYQCTGLYVLVALLTLVGFVFSAAEKPHWGTAFRKSAMLVLGLTLVVHTLALLARMYIMERPGVFVTNLYSSAVFIGWGCVALGLFLERLYPIGVGNILAAVLGLATSIVAHNLATEDTLEMMQAVLDTNFWLATHVTTVTLGYTATFVAGFLGLIYVLLSFATVIRDSFLSKAEPTVASLLSFGVAVVGVASVPLWLLWFLTAALDKFEVLHPLLLWGVFAIALAAGIMYTGALLLLRITSEGTDAHGNLIAGQVPALAKPLTALALRPESSKIIGQMIYGVLCFATMLSFIGTVLGGIWADQSWGRFWGWDPKENGAVLIVLWNSLILHARWCGLVKARGMALLTIFGNVITAWSWFGTNQLGIGLHAYGFDTRLADGCYNFWLSQLSIMFLGLVIVGLEWGQNAGAVSRAVPVAPAPTHGGSPNGDTNGQPYGHNNSPQQRPGKKKRHGKR